jgi:lysozyme
MARVSARVVALALAAATSLTVVSEGTLYKTYLDPVGIPTACTGHTGPEVRMGQVYTKAQCLAFLDADEKKAMQIVLDSTVGPMNSNELAALTDFTLNVGGGNFRSSTLRKLWNEGNHAAACRELPRWVYAKGIVLKGLVTRRAKEMALCLLPTAS